MKRPTKLMFGILGVIFASEMLVYLWQAKIRAASTIHLANGMEVLPLGVQPNDVERAMENKVWNFNIQVPPGRQSYWYLVDLYRDGKFVRSVGGGGYQLSKKQNNLAVVTIALFPVDSSFTQAAKLQCLTMTNGGFTEGTADNPFLGSAALSYQPQAAAKANSITLISQYSQHNADGLHFSGLSLALDIAPMGFRRLLPFEERHS